MFVIILQQINFTVTIPIHLIVNANTVKIRKQYIAIILQGCRRRVLHL